MQTEGKFLQKLQGCIGIPRVFFSDLQKEVYFDSHCPRDFGMTGKRHWRRALVMERFAVDLKHWCNQKLTELTVRQLCYQLLNILQGVHKFGILHLDIKPENIMFKHKISPKDVKFKSPNEEQDIYLIDFGLAADLGEAEIARTLGDPSFRSRSQHVGNPQGRKDDLEIIANMALLLMGQATWISLAGELEHLEEIGEPEGSPEYEEVVDQIADSKVAAFADPPKDLPGWLSGFMRHIDAMDVGFAPENYDYERSFFFIAS